MSYSESKKYKQPFIVPSTEKIQESTYLDGIVLNNYELTAWNTKSDGTGTNYLVFDEKENENLEKITLYGQWERRKSYNQFFLADGNTANINETDGVLQLKEPDPDSSLGELKLIDSISELIGGDINNIVSVDCDQNVQEIGDYAFSDSYYITDINCRKTKKIGSNAFQSSQNLSSVKCDYVEEIGDYAFSQIYPEFSNLSVRCYNVKKIGKNAFASSRITEIRVPNLEEAGEDAFGETYLSSIDCRNLKRIGSTCFIGCSKLSNINCNDVQEISAGAFNYCESLQKLQLNQISVIENAAFSYCDSLSTISIPEENEYFKTENNGTELYSKDGKRLCWISIPNRYSFTVPDDVTELDTTIFAGNDNLSSVSLGQNTDISSGLFFYSSPNISVLTVPETNENLTMDEYGKILYNKEKTKVIYCVPKAQTEIAWTGDKVIRLDENSTEITPYAFYDFKREEGSVRGESITTVDKNAFRISDIRNVNTNPSQLSTDLEIPNVTRIENSAFRNCNQLGQCWFTDLSSIGEYAFTDCKNLSSFRNGGKFYEQDRNLSSVIEIKSRAFDGCKNLLSAEFRNVKTIGVGAFCNCSSLSVMNISEAVDIERSMMYNCKNLHAISFKDRKNPEIPKITATTLIKNGTSPLSILIPENMYDDWSSADVWKDLITKKTIELVKVENEE